MLTYLLVPGLALLSSWVGRVVPRPHRPRDPRTVEPWQLAYLLTVLVLAVFAGGRVAVGTDYGLYTAVFRRSDPAIAGLVLQNTDQELGFTLGVLGLRTLTDDPQALFFVASFLTVVWSAAAIRRTSVNFALSMTLYVLLGFYLAPFNVLRQGLAVALNFLAYTYMDRRPAVFVALNVVAQLIHSSTLIAVVAQVGLRRLRPTGRSFVALLVVAGVATFFVPTVVANLGFLSFLDERYLAYLDGQQSGIGTYLYLLSRLLLVVLLLRFRPQDGSIDRYLTLSMVGVALLLLGTQAEVIGRLELYFGVYLLVALPRALQEVPTRARGTAVLVVLAGSLAFYVAYATQFGDLIPYRFAWSTF